MIRGAIFGWYRLCQRVFVQLPPNDSNVPTLGLARAAFWTIRDSFARN